MYSQSKVQTSASIIFIALGMIIIALIIKPIFTEVSYNKSDINSSSESGVEHLYLNIGKATKAMFFHELKAKRF